MSRAPLAALLLLTACASGGDRGGGGGTDAGSAADGGAIDAGGGVDSGGGSDAATPDGGGVDSGGGDPDSGPCSEFAVLCGDECVDTTTDPRHCGGCDRSCSITRDCVGGECVEGCGEGLARCGAECVDITSDPANCGACGRACLPTESCTIGRCEPCPAGLSECGTACVDLATDEAHCGMCDMACPAGENCAGGACRRGLSGMTGMTWELVPGTSQRGFQAWVPSGETYIYAGSGSAFRRLEWMTGTWSDLAGPPAGTSLAGWGSPALTPGVLWQLRNESILRYDIATNTWTRPRMDLHGGGDEHAMTVTDRDDVLWSFNSMRELVKYDPATDTVTYYPSGVTDSTFETRLAYDETTHSIYFGGFTASPLNRFDIATTTFTTRASIPEAGLNDIFCSDHNGHIYAAGGSGGMTMFQYDITTDTWSRIPDYPVSHGVNGSCAVLEDGWLYVEPGDTPVLYRLQLF